MNKGFTLVATFALSSVFVASIADAGTIQKKKSSSGGYSGPETGLLGIKLYDSGLRVISTYGNPDTITTVGGSGGAAGGGGGQGGPPGGFGGGGGRNSGGGGNGPATPVADVNLPAGLIPGAFGEPVPNMVQGRAQGIPGRGDGGGDAPGGGRGGGGAPPSPGGGAPGGAGATAATESTAFTRWTYVRNGCRLGFVIDKFNRVVQIEAIGLQNQRIKTRRGVGFGSTFSSVMKSYASSTVEPDGYDISGNNFTIRFLTRHRVAFRLSQLSTKKAHVVTGIVVAAGKQ